MQRQFLVYLLLSILVVIFARYAHLLVVYIDMAFTFVNVKLTPVFSQTGIGLMVRKVILLAILPALLAGVLAVLYRLIKGSNMPHYMELTWVLWLIIVLSDILIK